MREKVREVVCKMKKEKREENYLQYKKSRERGRNRIVKEGSKEVHCTAEERKELKEATKKRWKEEREKARKDRQIAINRDLHHHYCT